MKPVTVGRYRPDQFDGPPSLPDGKMPGGHGWLGWAETEDWIVWEHENGELYVYNGRDRDSGAVLGAPHTLPRLGEPRTVEGE